jgi:hypothetical protein
MISASQPAHATTREYLPSRATIEPRLALERRDLKLPSPAVAASQIGSAVVVLG